MPEVAWHDKGENAVKKLCLISVVFLLSLLQLGTLHAQWAQTNGPYGGNVKCFAVSGTHLFAGTYDSGLRRRRLSEMTASTREFLMEPATSFCLRQNHPNPFNPSTAIRFELPNKSDVTLKVFVLLGREVATLLNGMLDAGTHTKIWNATGIPGGMYICRLQAGCQV